jgi:hypothetical protein
MNDEQPTNGTDRSTNSWESEMSREFDKRVRDLHEAPLTFDNVRGKAMTIRRNRRIAVATGVLAAAAVVVPIAVIAGNGLGDSNQNSDPVTSPSPTPTEAPLGAIGVSYLEGQTWRRADGTTVELGTRYDGGTELGDDLLAVRNSNGRLTVDVVDTEGSVSESFRTLSYPVANADRTMIAYAALDGTLVTRWADGQATMADGLVDGYSVTAVTGGSDCTEGGEGCRVFVNRDDLQAPAFVDSGGSGLEVIPRAVRVNDVSRDGRVALQLSYSDTGSCSAVRDGPKGVAVFETCVATLFAFSPDAAYLSGGDSYLDGIGLGYLTIRDAGTGEELARFEPQGQGFVRDSVWEDAEHLLVNTFEQGEWRIYRFGVDGTSEQVLFSTEGDEMTPAFVLLGNS